jgi:hypothetical protein
MVRYVLSFYAHFFKSTFLTTIAFEPPQIVYNFAKIVDNHTISETKKHTNPC